MISNWSTRFNAKVIRCEDRPDQPQGDIIYRLVELFTTRDGSWEPSDKPGSIPDWARSKYLRAPGAPDYNDDGGADHHLFARVLGLDGQPMTTDRLIRYWSDGFSKLGDGAYNGFLYMTPKPRSGWANEPVFNHFSPERNESGAWCWCPQGASDVVVGGGLPNNQHVSFFAVWQAERRDTTPVTPPTPVVPAPLDPPNANLTEMRQQAWGQVGVNFNRDSSFAQYARLHNLGAPLTNEFDVDQYRAQGFANGIVYARIGAWDNITHATW